MDEEGQRPRDAAIPIARRIVAVPAFFPLWLRRRRGPDARLPMVGWFDPGSCSPLVKSLLSLVIGEQSDRRIVQALAARRQQYYDHSIDSLCRRAPRTAAA